MNTTNAVSIISAPSPPSPQPINPQTSHNSPSPIIQIQADSLVCVVAEFFVEFGEFGLLVVQTTPVPSKIAFTPSPRFLFILPPWFKPSSVAKTPNPPTPANRADMQLRKNDPDRVAGEHSEQSRIRYDLSGSPIAGG